ncbi:hypothetical protein GCM10027162_05530 [Streptomyces incanus]
MRHYLWRVVDQDGNVLDILVRFRRDAAAARRFPAKPMKKQCRGIRRKFREDACQEGEGSESSPFHPVSGNCSSRAEREVAWWMADDQS